MGRARDEVDASRVVATGSVTNESARRDDLVAERLDTLAAGAPERFDTLATATLDACDLLLRQGTNGSGLSGAGFLHGVKHTERTVGRRRTSTCRSSVRRHRA